MIKKALTEREKIILYMTVGVLIFGIVFIFLVMPALKKTDCLNKDINIARMKLKKYMKLLNRKEYIQNKYQKFTSNANLPDMSKDRLVGALSAVQTFAKDSNIQIIDIRPQNPGGRNLYKELFIDLRTQGTIEGYLKFIYNIENSLLLLRIKRFQLNAKPDTGLLEGSFSISQLSITE